MGKSQRRLVRVYARLLSVSKRQFPVANNREEEHFSQIILVKALAGLTEFRLLCFGENDRFYLVSRTFLPDYTLLFHFFTVNI